MAKWKAALLVSFFLGFPLAGMLLVWYDTHGKIRWRAEEFVQSLAPTSFAKWNGARIKENWNQLIDAKQPQPEEWAKWKETYGEATGPVTVSAYSSYTSERQDSMWQVVKMRVNVPGKVKAATVDVEVARMTMGPRWHFEKVSVKDAQP